MTQRFLSPTLPAGYPEDPPTDALQPRWAEHPILEWAVPDATHQVVATLREISRAFVSAHELGLLYELAAGHHQPDVGPGYVVEYGSMDGGSACAFGAGLRDAGTSLSAPVIAVDRYGWDDYRVPHDYRHTISTANYIEAREAYWRADLAGDYVAQIVTSSFIFLEFWNQPIRVLFIDSSHLYAPTLHEIVASEPLLVPGAWIVFDDYGPDSEWNTGVAPAVNVWLEHHPDVKIFRGDRSALFINMPSVGHQVADDGRVPQ